VESLTEERDNFKALGDEALEQVQLLRVSVLKWLDDFILNQYDDYTSLWDPNPDSNLNPNPNPRFSYLRKKLKSLLAS
jgi:hypothetical protein